MPDTRVHVGAMCAGRYLAVYRNVMVIPLFCISMHVVACSCMHVRYSIPVLIDMQTCNVRMPTD